MLHDFILANRAEIIRRCRGKVAARSIPPPSVAEIEHGVPVFLDQLCDALPQDGPHTDIARTALLHGQDLLAQGLTVSQVVHDYGDVCQSITELAMEHGAPIGVDDFRKLNKCLDDAIASAVTAHGREPDLGTSGAVPSPDSERLGFLAHELRNLIGIAMAAFEVIDRGSVGTSGSTGTVLRRSLTGMRDLIARSLTEVRLAQGIHHSEPVVVAELIDELVPSARLQATTHGVTLTVSPGDRHLTLQGDRAVLSAVLMNLLQNACKFTKPGTAVRMQTFSRADRIIIEVEDECGGLSATDLDHLFRPYDQRRANRSGLGLGLSFCRWGVEANGGRISARTVPGVGCVFIVDLPATVAERVA